MLREACGKMGVVSRKPVSSNEMPRWAPRVESGKIRRLYESDAKGMRDDELLEEIGTAFYARCKSVLMVNDAVWGKRVHCPGCEGIVPRTDDEALRCPSCDWSVSWKAYQKTYQGKRLFGGGGTPEFEAYVENWPKARTPADKMLAVDRLINAIHKEATLSIDEGGRPVAVMLIEGGMKDVIVFLDSLAFGEKSTPGVVEAHREWEQRMNRALARWSKHNPDPKSWDSIEAMRRTYEAQRGRGGR